MARYYVDKLFGYGMTSAVIDSDLADVDCTGVIAGVSDLPHSVADLLADLLNEAAKEGCLRDLASLFVEATEPGEALDPETL